MDYCKSSASPYAVTQMVVLDRASNRAIDAMLMYWQVRTIARYW